MKNDIGCRMIIVSILAFVLGGGCQPESESDVIQKARLVGQQNIELNKQIRQKDQEIQNQKDLLSQCKKDMATEQEQTALAQTKLLDIVRQATQETETLRTENEQLKIKLKAAESN